MVEGGALAETLCEVVEEVPWKKVLRIRGIENCHKSFTGGVEAGELCRGSSTQMSEALMDGFNEKDAANLERVKDAMAEKAAGGGLVSGPDAAAAAAFAALLEAETRRAELTLKSAGLDKAPAASPAASWTETVTAGKQTNPEPALAA